MAMKQSQWKIKGMQRDISVSSFNPEFSYENKNMRILTTGENTSFALTNEKGTKEIVIPEFQILGTPIGQSVINNQWIIFTTDIKDRIYKITDDGTFHGELLYEGNLNFNERYPIETIPYYENNSTQKIYWTDGYNQPRVINIAASQDIKDSWNDFSFDFVQRLKLQEKVTITRNDISNGMFAPGTIQYCFSYYNQYNQQSCLFYVSPLYYTSYSDRGASPDSVVSVSFSLHIDNLDSNFQYVRVYSILRTSIDSSPQCKIVIDVPINKETLSMDYVDTGTEGSQADPTELLYVGGEEAVFGTMTQKNNTLFLGDIETKRKIIPDEVKNYFAGKSVSFAANKSVNVSESAEEHYGYKNQLSNNSQQIKTFKYLEWYRFGIQFQHVTGKWSEPVFINDCQNTVPNGMPDSSLTNVNLVTANLQINDQKVIDSLLEYNYIKARPVVVYPKITDRECLCQGIVCPTVYNISDRYNNTPFAISSWYARPNSGISLKYLNQSKESQSWIQQSGNPKTYDIHGSQEYYHNSLTAGVWNGNQNQAINRYAYNGSDTSPREDIDIFNRGSWTEFRHNKHLPFNTYINSEIQCMYDVYHKVIENGKALPDIIDSFSEDERNKIYTDDLSKVDSLALEKSGYYYVDKSIVTLHSPEIEFDSGVQSLDLSSYKFRIVGVVPITSHQGDIDIITEGTVQIIGDDDVTYSPKGFYKENSDVRNISLQGWKTIMGAPYWLDGYSKEKNKVESTEIGYIVYPWNRDALTNFIQNPELTSAKIKYKKMSNLRYSICTKYINAQNIWNSYEEGNSLKTGVSDIQLFNSDQETLVKLKSPKNSSLPPITYFGNVDKIVTPYVNSKIDSEGYPIMVSQTLGAVVDNDTIVNSNNLHTIFSNSNWIPIGGLHKNNSGESTMALEHQFSKQPVRIRFKSSPHLVTAFNYSNNNEQRILPSLDEINKENESTEKYAIWNQEIKYKVSQDSISSSKMFDVPQVRNCGYLWLGEIYNDDIKNRFGGKSEEAIENNQWLPCGDSVDIRKGQGISVVWSEGDTYYQRYDNLKTYPYSLEEVNGLVEIVSFMCETRINIDGRYDKNRGLSSNLSVSNTNFNRLNDAYSQQNNFFTYRTFNRNRDYNTYFPNSFTWTKTKTSGAIIDSWTNITLASIGNADQNKGKIRALRNYKDSIFIFQDNAIAQLLYNEQNQITTSEGVPVEIANSGKVQGVRYYSEHIGCVNKWSICETPNSLYFIDNRSKDLYSIGEGIQNISQNKGFSAFFKSQVDSDKSWNPLNNEFTAHFDKINKDIFFVNTKYCLAFNEALGEFSSFYSYENTPYFINLNNKFLQIHNNKIYQNNAGAYNYYYGVFQPYYVTVIANASPEVDKIFNQVEFRADMWDKDTFKRETFDALNVWNEYQSGHSKLVDVLDKPSTLKQKFRIWRANIPRATYGKNIKDIYKKEEEIDDIISFNQTININADIPQMKETRDRSRNPWLYIQLIKEQANDYKMILQDMVVNYFEEINNYYNKENGNN